MKYLLVIAIVAWLAVLWPDVALCLLMFPVVGLLPCPDCCVSCVILSDGFDRSDSTNVGSSWSEAEGDWSISGNRMSVGSTAAVLVAASTNPDGETTHIECIVRTATSGNKARLLLNYVDEDNYHFAEVHIQSSGYIRLYSRVGGSNTQLATNTINLSTDTNYTFTACISATAVFHAAIGSGTFNRISVDISPIVNGDAFGLGTGDAVSGTVLFDEFVASKVSSECESCAACNFCDDTVPEQIQVVVSGGWTGNFGCDNNCNTDLPGTYILDYRGNVTPFQSANVCVWSYEFPTHLCGFNFLHFWLDSTAFVCSFSDTSTDTGTYFLRWSLAVTTPYDCAGISNLNLTGGSNPPVEGAAAPCLSSTATAIATAL